MNTIQNYLENMFAAYPQTPEVQKAKSELLNMMEDKYNELKNEGKSENEAIGIVISEFGNIEEIAQEFGFGKQPEPEEPENMPELVEPAYTDKPYVDIQLAEEYIAADKGETIFNAIGVALCILSPCWVLLFSIISFLQNVGIVLLLITIALGVGAFILGEQRIEPYKFMKKSFYMSRTTADWITEERFSIKQGGKIYEVIGILSFIVSPVGVILLGRIPIIRNISPIFVLICVAIGVFFCIYGSAGEDACKKMLKKGKVVD